MYVLKNRLYSKPYTVTNKKCNNIIMTFFISLRLYCVSSYTYIGTLYFKELTIFRY